jgi:hypothetical protein
MTSLPKTQDMSGARHTHADQVREKATKNLLNKKKQTCLKGKFVTDRSAGKQQKKTGGPVGGNSISPHSCSTHTRVCVYVCVPGGHSRHRVMVGSQANFRFSLVTVSRQVTPSFS